jgi:hypothetical protein
MTIPDPLSDRAASFLGSEVANDPAFWMVVLETGVEELERQFRAIEADARKKAEDSDTVVIFGAPTIIGPAEPYDDDEDDDHHDDRDDDLDGIPF